MVTVDEPMQNIISQRTFIKLAAILIPLFVYMITIPGNHTEAEDAFAYAKVAENPEASWVQFQHMLYFPTIKGIHKVLVFFGNAEHSYHELLVFHLIAGVFAVFLFQCFLYNRLKVTQVSSLIGAFLLAFTYGFWRYAVEVEIPVWTCLMSLVLLYFGFCKNYTLSRVLGLGMIGALAILFHGLNALIACTIIPLRMFIKAGIWYPFAYAASAAVILFTVYAYGGSIDSTTSTASAIVGPLKLDVSFNPIFLVKGAIGLGQAGVSGNFVFGNEWLAKWVESSLVSKTLTEEIYMGQSAPKWLFYASIATIILTCLSFLWLIISRLQLRDRMPANKDIYYIIIWLAIFLTFIMLFGDGSPEMPIAAWVPIWTLIIFYVVDPLCRNNKILPCVCFSFFFFLHNLTGGMAWVWSPDSDYYKARSVWLLDNVEPNDLIVTGERHGLTRYLRYWSEMNILNLHEVDKEALHDVEDKIDKWQGNVYVLEEVIDRPAYLCFKGDGYCDRLSEFSARFASKLKEVPQTGPSTIYRIE